MTNFIDRFPFWLTMSFKFSFAVVQNAITGRSRGSVGGVTFATWKGLNILRGKPQEVKNPKTDKQKIQRSKLTALVGLYRSTASIVKAGFSPDAIEKSEYNAWMSYNIKKAVTGSASAPATIDFSKILMAKGSIGNDKSFAVTFPIAGQKVLAFDWGSGSKPVGSTINDQLFLLLINYTQKTYTPFLALLKRGTGATTSNVSFPNNVASGDVLYVYAFFQSALDNNVSDSQFFTNTVTKEKKDKG